MKFILQVLSCFLLWSFSAHAQTGEGRGQASKSNPPKTIDTSSISKKGYGRVAVNSKYRTCFEAEPRRISDIRYLGTRKIDQYVNQRGFAGSDFYVRRGSNLGLISLDETRVTGTSVIDLFENVGKRWRGNNFFLTPSFAAFGSSGFSEKFTHLFNRKTGKFIKFETGKTKIAYMDDEVGVIVHAGPQSLIWRNLSNGEIINRIDFSAKDGRSKSGRFLFSTSIWSTSFRDEGQKVLIGSASGANSNISILEVDAGSRSVLREMTTGDRPNLQIVGVSYLCNGRFALASEKTFRLSKSKGPQIVDLEMREISLARPELQGPNNLSFVASYNLQTIIGQKGRKDGHVVIDQVAAKIYPKSLEEIAGISPTHSRFKNIWLSDDSRFVTLLVGARMHFYYIDRSKQE